MTLEAAYRKTGQKIVGYLVATGTDEAAARDLLHDAVVRVATWLKQKYGADEGRAPDSVLGEGRAPGSVLGEGRAPSRPYESTDNLSAFLFTTARNLRANRVRDDSRLSLVDSVSENAATADARDALPPSDAEYIRSRIAAALGLLPDSLREAYTLYQIAELSVSEVASLTGVSENLVKVRLHRAKKALRKTLADLDARCETRDAGVGARRETRDAGVDARRETRDAP